MLLENNTNYSHLQRSIDTLRSLGDRLGERNVDLRLNLHQDPLRSERNGLSLERNGLSLDRNGLNGLNFDRMDRNNGLLDRNTSSLFERNSSLLDRTSGSSLLDRNGGLLDRNTGLNGLNLERNGLNLDRNGLIDRNIDRNGLGNDRNISVDSNRNLELNLSLNSNERNILQERMQQERNLNLERLINERNLNDHRSLEHSLSIERLNLERSLAQHDRALTDRNLNNVDRMVLDRNLNNDRNNDRLRGLDLQNDIRQDINDMKYREYKAHLDSLRNTDSSRSVEGRDVEDRGNSSTPPTPISVGENFQEEKVIFHFFFVSKIYFALTNKIKINILYFNTKTTKLTF